MTSYLVLLYKWLVEQVSQHVVNSFRRQQSVMQGQDSWHLLNGESWQGNGGAVTQKPGYTLHCVACTVTVQGACEMGQWWPECLERIQNLFEVLVQRENAQVNLSCAYSISQAGSISCSCITGFILESLYWVSWHFPNSSKKNHSQLKYIYFSWDEQTVSVSAVDHWLVALSHKQ